MRVTTEIVLVLLSVCLVSVNNPVVPPFPVSPRSRSQVSDTKRQTDATAVGQVSWPRRSGSWSSRSNGWNSSSTEKWGVGWTGESFREHVQGRSHGNSQLAARVSWQNVRQRENGFEQAAIHEALREQNGTAITISLCRDCHPYT